VKRLRQESEVQKMYQSQGKLEVLTLLLDLRKDLRDFAKRVQTGEVKLNEKGSVNNALV
jgi:hypothetical protein